MKTLTPEEVAFMQKLMYQKVCERKLREWYMCTIGGRHHVGVTLCMKPIEDREAFCAEHLHTMDAKAVIPEVPVEAPRMPFLSPLPKRPGRKTGKAKRCQP